MNTQKNAAWYRHQSWHRQTIIPALMPCSNGAWRFLPLPDRAKHKQKKARNYAGLAAFHAIRCLAVPDAESFPQHCKEVMLEKLRTWQAKQHKKIDDDLGFFGFNSSELQNELSSSSEKIIKEINELGNTSEKNALQQYNFIAEHIGMQISTGYGRKKDPKIDDHKETDFDWKMIPFVPFILVALPFITPFIRKDDAKKMHTAVDTFAMNVKDMINEKVTNLEISLKTVKEKISNEII